mmetsp:Transcript_31561/g.52654  ORF Transcript_31561/g.52654 Transcript_31561/m.52654 type:complete len:211 (+) Transcript_31561:62-694(+)
MPCNTPRSQRILTRNVHLVTSNNSFWNETLSSLLSSSSNSQQSQQQGSSSQQTSQQRLSTLSMAGQPSQSSTLASLTRPPASAPSSAANINTSSALQGQDLLGLLQQVSGASSLQARRPVPSITNSSNQIQAEMLLRLLQQQNEAPVASATPQPQQSSSDISSQLQLLLQGQQQLRLPSPQQQEQPNSSSDQVRDLILALQSRLQNNPPT